MNPVKTNQQLTEDIERLEDICRLQNEAIRDILYAVAPLVSYVEKQTGETLMTARPQ